MENKLYKSSLDKKFVAYAEVLQNFLELMQH